MVRRAPFVFASLVTGLALLAGASNARAMARGETTSRQEGLALAAPEAVRSLLGARTLLPNTDVGPNAPGVASGWTNSLNVQSSDDVYATTCFQGRSNSATLTVSTFGFDLPSNALIVGIKATVERHSNNSYSNISDSGIYLQKASGRSGANRSVGAYWGTTDSTQTYGGSADLWGTTWTAADINNTAFGLQVIAASNTDSTYSGYVDRISVTVTYTIDTEAPAASPVNVALPVVTGAAHVGATLTATQGTWSGNPAVTLADQWYDCRTNGGTCAAISGATGSVYVTTTSDYGYTVRFAVTATNGVDPPVSAFSAPVNLIADDSASYSPAAATGWTNSLNVQSSDNVYATTLNGGRSNSATLTATNFGFDLPSNAVIVGITATVERHSNNAYSNITDASIYLQKVSGQAGVNKADGAVWGTSDFAQPYGGPTNLWGTTWTAADINNTAFGLQIIANSNTDSTYSLYVDQISVKVTYTIDRDASLTPPANVAIPAVSGAAHVGSTLTATQGTWSGNPAITRSGQWYDCVADADTSACAAIAGAVNASYTAIASDFGYTLRFKVTATNSEGTLGTFSAPTNMIADDSGPNPPSTATGWTNSLNVQSSDNVYATTYVQGRSNSATLTATNFGFGLPSNATIVGITATVERHTNNSTNNISDASIYLQKASGQVGANKANGYWGTADSTQTYGGPTNLWGTTWTPADVNDSHFGLRLVANSTTDSTLTASVDQIAVKVTWVTKSVDIALPVNISTSPPTISGQYAVGNTLVADLGQWTTIPTLAIDWYRCATTCTDLGVSTMTYTTTVADVGYSLKARVTATNAYGSSTADSAQTPVIIDQASLEELALVYRPALLFDTNEQYRPIALDSFFAEGTHKVCIPDPILADVYCDPLTSPADIVPDAAQLAQDYGNDVDKSYVWISHDGDTYASPSAPCGPDANLVDCDDQPGIYYDYAQSATGYRFLDYWVFYRNNPVSADSHAGDWEGLTVWLAPTATPAQPAQNQIAGVVFAAHSYNIFRLPFSLQFCPSGAATYTACDNAAASTHVADYVALNSHASYEASCVDDSCWNPESFADVHPPEGRHNGLAGWSANSDAECSSTDCVIPLTPIDGTPTPDWVTYAGQWGGSTGNGVAGSSPFSPGNPKQKRYACTQAAWACDGLSSEYGDPVPDGSRNTAIAHAKPKPSAFSLCRSWWDTNLAAYACSQSRWTKTVAAAQTMVPGRFKIVIGGRHTGSAPGLVQVVGGPLMHPDTVRLVGHPEKDEVVKVNYYSGGRFWVATLTKISVKPGAALHLTGNGKPKVSLHALHAHVNISLLTPKPATPAP